MTRMILVAAIVLALAAPALAQLTVVTDESTYVVGDVVEITIHNGGPSEAVFAGSPLYSILHVESGAVIYGETQVPEITFFGVGETEVFGHDTDAYPHEPGHYRIVLNVFFCDPGSITETTYVLDPPVDVESMAWGAIKALSR